MWFAVLSWGTICFCPCCRCTQPVWEIAAERERAIMNRGSLLSKEKRMMTSEVSSPFLTCPVLPQVFFLQIIRGAVSCSVCAVIFMALSKWRSSIFPTWEIASCWCCSRQLPFRDIILRPALLFIWLGCDVVSEKTKHLRAVMPYQSDWNNAVRISIPNFISGLVDWSSCNMQFFR